MSKHYRVVCFIIFTKFELRRWRVPKGTQYREGTKKRAESFLRYLSEFLSHSVDFFFTIYSKVWSFLEVHFWGVQALVTLIFHAFFAFRPLKKGLKTPWWPQNSKFHHVKVSPKPLHYMISTSHAQYLFRPKRVFLVPQLKITYFGHFWTLNFREKKTFGLKKPTFKWVCRPQNIILHHFFACSKHPLIPYVHISKYLKKIFWSQNMWYFEKSRKNAKNFW